MVQSMEARSPAADRDGHAGVVEERIALKVARLRGEANRDNSGWTQRLSDEIEVLLRLR